MSAAALRDRRDTSQRPNSGHAFAAEIVRIGSQALRVGRQPGHPGAGGVPLLMFNGIGGNIELLEPIARQMPEREVITFDVPGVGHSAMPARPYRMRGIARLAAAVLKIGRAHV